MTNEELEGLECFSFEFELLNSEDGKVITLVCHTDQRLAPDEYAEALRNFADRVETLCSMSEASDGPLN